MKKKILITGASGFIGLNLVSKISKSKSFEVYALQKKQSKELRKIKKIKFINLDITKIKKKLLFNFDYIINLAGNINHKNKSQTYNAHYNGVKNLIKYVHLKKLKLFIQVGSSLEYGQKESPHRENFTCKPISHYGKAKLLATKFIQKKLEKYLVLRPYQVYGPYQKKNRLIPIIIDGCLKNKSFACSDGTQFRDFLYIDDFSELILKILKSKKINYGIFNIGFGKPHKVKNIISLIQKKIKKGKPLFGKIEMRKEEMTNTYPDISKIKKIYNWKPKIKINDGLKKTIDFYEK